MTTTTSPKDCSIHEDVDCWRCRHCGREWSFMMSDDSVPDNCPDCAEYPDISGALFQIDGQEPAHLLPGEAPIPMFSYNRVSAIFWQAFFETLLDRGYTQAEAVKWLQSKGARHALDQHAAMLIAAGKCMALTADKSYLEE